LVKPALFSFLRAFSRLPLPLIHFLGALAGLLGLLRSRHRRIVRDNLRAAGYDSLWMLLATAAELGKGYLELIPIWLRPYDQILAWVREVNGWEHVEAALARGKGVIVLGPHLGCLELAGLFIASRLPITALYRPPRQAWVHQMMQAGRARGQARMVEPDIKGVRALLTALKHNQAAWVLPDQSANSGEGLLMRFLERPAYLPTLLYRLHASTGAVPLVFACERLGFGRGYRLWIESLAELPADPALAAPLVNGCIEHLIRRFPSQYLWSYRLHREQGAAAGQEPLP
jgi:Kdo2-lipid IVA lauroyltransferase/acyltransferase